MIQPPLQYFYLFRSVYNFSLYFTAFSLYFTLLLYIIYTIIAPSLNLLNECWCFVCISVALKWMTQMQNKNEKFMLLCLCLAIGHIQSMVHLKGNNKKSYLLRCGLWTFMVTIIIKQPTAYTIYTYNEDCTHAVYLLKGKQSLKSKDKANKCDVCLYIYFFYDHFYSFYLLATNQNIVVFFFSCFLS